MVDPAPAPAPDPAPDPAPAPAPAPAPDLSDSDRITALETKLTSLIELLKSSFTDWEDGQDMIVYQLFSLTNKKNEVDSL